MLNNQTSTYWLYFTEYQIMNYFSATLCQNVAPQNTMTLTKLNKKSSHRYIDEMFRLMLLIYDRTMKKYMSKFM